MLARRRRTPLPYSRQSLRFWIRFAPSSRAVEHDCRTIDASDSASFDSSDSSVYVVCIHLPRPGLLRSLYSSKIMPRKERTIADRRRSATRPTRRGMRSKSLPFRWTPWFTTARGVSGDNQLRAITHAATAVQNTQ